ncbi:serine hydrolase [Allokutzneria sp. NRRL B-24872]|uniref:serine hydrolase n=1 Tax=Allokutzneria sp. NRRL B-24872 TaxID=1137961 RepID=UPI001FEFB030|nr:serine hydrolase [Allokutzneria sp. NRRL B-24872]
MHRRLALCAAAAASVALLMGGTAAMANPTPAPTSGSVEAEFGAHFPAALKVRIAKAQKYAESRPGVTGIVVRDRLTGAVWRNAAAGTHAWACSTPKLAMVVDLLLRNDSGAVKLTAEDRELIHKMLNSSDDDAAHTLWKRYGGEAEFAKRFPLYGMTDMKFTDKHPHHWGWILTTPNDLDRLINYVLEKLPAKHRAYIVKEMRAVDPNQQWGVWGAGAKAQPGNKNGWSDDNDDGSWIMNSVGFVGPRERYTVAIMSNTMVIQDGFNVGKETTTKVGEILFNGYFG